MIESASMVPNYDQIEDALTGVQSPFSPEDCHGMLCAMLIVNNSLKFKRWLDEICTRSYSDGEISSASHDAFTCLYDHTRQELDDSLLNFSLLIPEEDSTLSQRVASLKKWCDGFLFGLALAGLKDMSQLPEDSYEIMQDIVSISQASEDDEEDEINEAAYLDIVEYVRMGVLLVNEELQPTNSPFTIQ